ncbi:DUF4012 domain-containing protein [Candidatus Microgenomates bacterium]|nr:DUF4012 domain-containing protein [Candidatus Microgenomates bacterium]
MEKTSHSFKSTPSEEDLPSVLVIGGGSFFERLLCRHLLEKNCRIFYGQFKRGKQNLDEIMGRSNLTLLPDPLSKSLDIIKQLNYVIFFGDLSSLELKTFTPKLLEFAAQKSARILLIQRRGKTVGDMKAPAFLGDYRLVRLGDLYGPGMDFEEDTQIADLFNATKMGGEIEIAGEGLDSLFPLFIADAIAGVIKVLLTPGIKGKNYDLAGQPISILDFVHLLQKNSPQKIKIEFVKPEKSRESEILNGEKAQQEIGWQPQTHIERGIEGTVGSFSREIPTVTAKTEARELKSDLIRSATSPSKFFRNLFLGLLILLALFFPALSIFWDVVWAKRDLSGVEKNFFSAPSSKIIAQAKNARFHFQAGGEKLTEIAWLFKLTRQEKILGLWQGQFDAGENVAGGVEELAQTRVILEKISRTLMGEEAIDSIQIKEAQTRLQSAQDLWSQAAAQSPQIGEKLAKYRRAVSIGKGWFAVLPQLIGAEEKQTYLLLLQNNMELRPTGGFIGSYGLFTFEKGRMDLKIEDVYTADGQLRGHVEPPAPIKKYLGEIHWFLRDSNWDPDFPQSAQKAQWFLEKEMGVKTEGVIAIDLNLAQNLLSVLGPINLPDYQETVTSQNLFEIAERHAQENFFPGSTQKRNFLNDLARQIILKAKDQKTENAKPLVQALTKSLNEGHLLIYFADSRIEDLVLQNGWDGRIGETPCRGLDNCLGDYQQIVEANLGMNKIGNKVKKQIEDQIEIGEDGQINHDLILKYRNESEDVVLMGGAYKNYLRVYTPEGAMLNSLTIDGVATKSADIATASGKTIFGFYFEVPSKGKKEIAVSYNVPGKIFLPEKFQYNFLIQKQPGIQGDPASLVLAYPNSWKKMGSAPALTPQDDLEYNSRKGDYTSPPTSYKDTLYKLKNLYLLSADQKIKVDFQK